MEIKKSEKASLENKRLLFTEAGLVIALLIVYFAFNWSSREAKVAALEDTTQVVVEEEMIAIQDNLPPPPPEAPSIPVLSDQIESTWKTTTRLLRFRTTKRPPWKKRKWKKKPFLSSW